MNKLMDVRASVHRLIDRLSDDEARQVLAYMAGFRDRNVTPAATQGHECQCHGACNR